MKKASYKFAPYFFGLGIICLDIITKKYALFHLSEEVTSFFPYGGKAVFANFLNGINFSLNLVKNTGAAWGLFSQYPHLLAYIRIAIVVFLIQRIAATKMTFLKKASFTCICAGATGNLIDHFKYGFVVDMFHFSFWKYDFPVFNVADAFIFIGVVALLFTKNRITQ